MDQAVSCRPLTAEVWVLFQASPYKICGGQICSETGFPLEFLGFSVSVSLHQCSILTFTHMLLLSEGQRRKIWKKAVLFRKLGSTELKSAFTPFVLLRHKLTVTTRTMRHPGSTMQAPFLFNVTNTSDILHRLRLKDSITCWRIDLSHLQLEKGQADSILFEPSQRGNS
jgi:hypothetical protein